MTHVQRIPPRLWIAAIAGFALAAAATVASAAGTSATSDDSSGAAGAFMLDNTTNAQVLDYTTPRELRICNRTQHTTESDVDWNLSRQWVKPRPVIQLSDSTNSQVPMPLAVTSQSGTAVIQPGECYRLRASHVRIASVGRVPAGNALSGNIQWVSPASAPPPNETATGAAGTASAHAMIADMQESLRQSDRTIREATAKLHQARRDLDSTTDTLNQVAATKAHNGKTVHEASAAKHAGSAR